MINAYHKHHSHGLQVADTLERRSQVIEILTDAVKAYQAADVMETQGEIYLKNLGMLSDSLDDLKDRHEGTAAKPILCLERVCGYPSIAQMS